MRNSILTAVLVFAVGCSSVASNKKGLCEGVTSYVGDSVSIGRRADQELGLYSVMGTFLKNKEGQDLVEIAFVKGKPPYMVIRVGALESSSSDHVDAFVVLDKIYVSDENCFRLTYIGNEPDGERQYSAQYVGFGRISEPE